MPFIILISIPYYRYAFPSYFPFDWLTIGSGSRPSNHHHRSKHWPGTMASIRSRYLGQQDWILEESQHWCCRSHLSKEKQCILADCHDCWYCIHPRSLFSSFFLLFHFIYNWYYIYIIRLVDSLLIVWLFGCCLLAVLSLGIIKSAYLLQKTQKQLSATAKPEALDSLRKRQTEYLLELFR